MNGGAAFVLVYIALAITVGLTVMIAEFCLGRARAYMETLRTHMAPEGTCASGARGSWRRRHGRLRSQQRSVMPLGAVRPPLWQNVFLTIFFYVFSIYQYLSFVCIPKSHKQIRYGTFPTTACTYKGIQAIFLKS